MEPRPFTPGSNRTRATGAIMTPIYATSTYVQQSPGVHKGFEYSRSQNPTRFAYEGCIAALEGGSRAFAFASGLAATATILDLLDSGDHVIAADDMYGGTFRLFERVRRQSAGLSFSYVDMARPENISAAVNSRTRLIWIETPSNPMLKLIDLAHVAEIGRSAGALTVADNTFATPWVQRPIEFGFDMAMHSATKYLNGHSDVIGGVVVVGANPTLAERLAFLQNATGAVPSPFDSFLVLRGTENAAPANAGALRERAEDCRMARSASERGEGDLSGPTVSPAARACQPANAWLRRHDQYVRQRRTQ